MNAGYSPIPAPSFLQELEDAEVRDGFVSNHVRTRFALLIRTLREQRGWSQAELGRRMGKPQSVVSRLEDPEYGRLSTQTIFEVAAAFGLPVYIDLPNWDEWFRLMEDMSNRNLQRSSFDAAALTARANMQNAMAAFREQSVAARAEMLLLRHRHMLRNVKVETSSQAAPTAAIGKAGVLANQASIYNSVISAINALSGQGTYQPSSATFWNDEGTSGAVFVGGPLPVNQLGQPITSSGGFKQGYATLGANGVATVASEMGQAHWNVPARSSLHSFTGFFGPADDLEQDFDADNGMVA